MKKKNCRFHLRNGEQSYNTVKELKKLFHCLLKESERDPKNDVEFLSYLLEMAIKL